MSRFVGKDGFIWWNGVVEDRKDPLLLGRMRVRIFGWHSKDKEELPTDHLPWAFWVAPTDDGKNISGAKEGDWVIGFFMDGEEAQQPCVFGKIHGIPEDKAPLDDGKEDIGFADATPDEELECGAVPRPPEMCPPIEIDEETGEVQERLGRFNNPNKLPGSNPAFGQLVSEIEGPLNNPSNFPFDMNGDGTYDQTDADLLAWDADRDGELSPIEERNRDNLIFDNFVGTQPANIFTVPISRYPLSHQLKEPTTSRLARNEKIEETIVGLKKGLITLGVTAGLGSLNKAGETNGNGTGEGTEAGEGSKKLLVGMETIAVENFEEPETPYAAIYPYNHVYESESGHVIEIDDTPGAERLHNYHRSGTFDEVHPDGTKVDKIVKDLYNMVLEHFFHHSGKSSNMVAEEDFKFRAGGVMVQQSGGTWNLDCGSAANIKIGADGNVIIGGAAKILVEGNCHLHTSGDMSQFVEGNLHINADGDIKMSSGGVIEIDAGNVSIPNGQVAVAGKATSANFAATASLGVPQPGAIPIFETANEVSDDTESVEEPESTTILAGFILDAPKSGDLYKPSSEGDGKLVCLSESNTPIRLYHAIPTGETEQVTIEYLHEDGSITSWDVVRPVYTWDEQGLIEEGYSTGILDGRSVWRFTKPGKDYPLEMIMVTGTKPDGWLIMDSSVRHD